MKTNMDWYEFNTTTPIDCELIVFFPFWEVEKSKLSENFRSEVFCVLSESGTENHEKKTIMG